MDPPKSKKDAKQLQCLLKKPIAELLQMLDKTKAIVISSKEHTRQCSIHMTELLNRCIKVREEFKKSISVVGYTEPDLDNAISSKWQSRMEETVTIHKRRREVAELRNVLARDIQEQRETIRKYKKNIRQINLALDILSSVPEKVDFLEQAWVT